MMFEWAVKCMPVVFLKKRCSHLLPRKTSSDLYELDCLKIVSSETQYSSELRGLENVKPGECAHHEL